MQDCGIPAFSLDLLFISTVCGTDPPNPVTACKSQWLPSTRGVASYCREQEINTSKGVLSISHIYKTKTVILTLSGQM